MPRLLTPDLKVVTGLALADLDPLGELSAGELMAAFGDVIPGLVDEWSLAGAAVAADYYDELRDRVGVKGRFTAIVDPPDMGADALVGWSTEPLRRPEPDAGVALSRLAGGLSKRIVNAANQVVTSSAQADPQARGWVRMAEDEACDFCVLIAERDVLYTDGTAQFATHEHCHCAAEPAFRGEPAPKYETPDRETDPGLRSDAREWAADNLT